MDIKDHHDAAINSLMLGLFNSTGDVSIYHVTKARKLWFTKSYSILIIMLMAARNKTVKMNEEAVTELKHDHYHFIEERFNNRYLQLPNTV